MWKKVCHFLVWTIVGSALLASAWNLVYANSPCPVYTEVDRWEVELSEVSRDGEPVEDFSEYEEPPVTLLSQRGGVKMIVGEEPDSYIGVEESDNYFFIRFGRGSIPDDIIADSEPTGGQ